MPVCVYPVFIIQYCSKDPICDRMTLWKCNVLDMIWLNIDTGQGCPGTKGVTVWAVTALGLEGSPCHAGGLLWHAIDHRHVHGDTVTGRRDNAGKGPPWRAKRQQLLTYQVNIYRLIGFVKRRAADADGLSFTNRIQPGTNHIKNRRLRRQGRDCLVLSFLLFWYFSNNFYF